MIELACIAEGAYLRHSAAMLHSTLQQLRNQPCRVHVLHGKPLEPAEQGKLQSVVNAFDCEVTFHAISEEQSEGLPGGYFDRSVWYRVLLPQLLPDLDKLLYLDSDMIVVVSILPLWETQISDYLLAAVTNPFYPFMPEYPSSQYGIKQAQDYFNSGVLLMNLKAMREEKLIEDVRDFARRYPKASYPDQDALNVVCKDRWLHLDPRWNLQSTFLELDYADLPIEQSVVSEARKSPAIIHFIGPYKPWHYACAHPLRALYFQHAERTPWGRPALEQRSVKHWLFRYLPLQWSDRWLAVEKRLRIWLRQIKPRRLT